MIEKNILMDLQLSVLTSLDDGDFLFKTDSNANVASFIIKELLDHNSGWKIFLLTPVKKNKAITTSYVGEAFTSDLTQYSKEGKLRFIPYEYFGNPFVDRITFDSRSLKRSLDKYARGVKLDIVYTNDPTKVLSYKTFFYYRQKTFVPIVCRNHWITGKIDRKVPEEIDFQVRQAEGALHCKSMSFNSKYAISQFLKNMTEYFNDEACSKVKNKLVFFETVDIDKIDRYKSNERFDKFTIGWYHRLSYYTGWEKTFDALLNLLNKRQDFQVIVTDPGNKFTQEELFSKYPFIKQIDKDSWSHEDYLKVSWKTDLVIGNHIYPATWGGLSITEPMAAFSVPLMLNKYCYPEMFWTDFRYPIFFKDEKEMIGHINFYINNPKKLEYVKKEARRFCKERLSMSNFIRQIEKQILS